MKTKLTQRTTRIASVLTIALVAGLFGLVLTMAPGTSVGSDTQKKSTATSPRTGVHQISRPVVHHKTAKINGLDIFYREAGPKDAPTVLLLHGFPTSSHMFRNLIPALADRYHIVAPDYPGYGNSSMPTVDEFDYTFDNMADIV